MLEHQLSFSRTKETPKETGFLHDLLDLNSEDPLQHVIFHIYHHSTIYIRNDKLFCRHKEPSPIRLQHLTLHFDNNIPPSIGIYDICQAIYILQHKSHHHLPSPFPPINFAGNTTPKAVSPFVVPLLCHFAILSHILSCQIG